ncbi:amino acid ABC transporter permease [Oculatella sp. LEGE 06141]|uniref:amino acid ABC transporter permease n=1 Tax=Oculatella sp. LEGE 06141 TaxID=1828648 RepID=UPI0019E8112B|nr:amino acid ABC transporter permease [Oculatella sp. LEGE 06141]MBE9178949.1 amino acid ABC transporter permease [Oculatella sp. LEGE 06141]
MIELRLLLESALITCFVSLAGFSLGIPLGLLVAVTRLKRLPVITSVLAVYVSFIRSLPLLLFIMLFYFGLPTLGIDLNPYVAGILALALNNAAFASEIWRGAIANFALDQIEAAKAYGMTEQQTFWRITLPQIWRASIPPITSEITLLVKASPAIGIIGIDDLTRRASTLAASNYEPVRMLTIATLFYVIIILAITQIGRMVDRRSQRQYELV